MLPTPAGQHFLRFVQRNELKLTHRGGRSASALGGSELRFQSVMSQHINISPTVVTCAVITPINVYVFDAAFCLTISEI